jgi:hypothetical protein
MFSEPGDVFRVVLAECNLLRYTEGGEKSTEDLERMRRWHLRSFGIGLCPMALTRSGANEHLDDSATLAIGALYRGA